MGMILNEYFLSVFTIKKGMDTRELGEINSGLEESPHYRRGGVTKKVDEGCVVDIVYVDFSKAFNEVPHSRLLYKCWSKVAEDRLQDCLDSVDWTVFKCLAENLDEYAITVTDFNTTSVATPAPTAPDTPVPSVTASEV
eukprot:g31946.t1